MSRTSKDNKTFRNSKERNAFIDSMPLLLPGKAANSLYRKLYNENRLPRFKATIKLCSSRGYNIKMTVDVLRSTFPGYLSNKSLTIEIFVDMLRKHSDIAEAWGYGIYGDDINNQLIKDKALELAMKTSDLEDIRQYNEMYNRENSGIQEGDLEIDGETTPKTFVFKLDRRGGE